MNGVHPELQGPLERLPKIAATFRVGRFVGRHGPKLLRSRKTPGVTVTNVRDGMFRARLYRPDSAAPRPALLWVHGGGLVIGAPKQDDPLCAETAAQLGVTIVSVTYRHAPEHPFPAAFDDVVRAWEWLLTHANGLGVDPSRIAIGGESAGAGLAAAAAHRIRDRGGIQPCAQWLFAPMLDDRTAARREFDAKNHPVWNNTVNRFAWACYLGHEPGAAQSPEYAVPARRRDLAGLPAAWLYAGDIELFHDEIVDYADRLRAAGVETQLEIVEGGAHGFENWGSDTDLARRLLRTAQAWLADHLSSRDAEGATSAEAPIPEERADAHGTGADRVQRETAAPNIPSRKEHW
ncbi:alpha/beta hydrolase [Kocuria sp. cx-116]|uniref:alpha/beta hydrolase n=1 Tax=Kocuria sp. cx-116 TaxID=2771378 RepID=UPI0016844EF6|nr:alpha/beta hydrolase [Kocuria sp. cx-116]MBD2762473.1 alpha/beta hydrolase [Kocuria sp. cx-116]